MLRLLGPISQIDLKTKSSSDIHWERYVVTHTAALGKTLAELDFRHRFGAVVTRANRADNELVTDGELAVRRYPDSRRKPCCDERHRGSGRQSIEGVAGDPTRTGAGFLGLVLRGDGVVWMTLAGVITIMPLWLLLSDDC